MLRSQTMRKGLTDNDDDDDDECLRIHKKNPSATENNVVATAAAAVVVGKQSPRLTSGRPGATPPGSHCVRRGARRRVYTR